MKEFALSTEGLSIFGKKYGDGEKIIFLFGGVHGDESEGIRLVNYVINNYLEKSELPKSISVVAIPLVNPDGEKAESRYNSNGIDLNRNMPTKDWTGEVLNKRYPPGESAASEVESKLLVDLIETYHPIFIITVHSYKHQMINVNGDCLGVELILKKHNGMKIEEDIGYPVPGSLGTYAAIDLGIPTITLELLRDGTDEVSLIKNSNGIIEAIEFLSK